MNFYADDVVVIEDVFMIPRGAQAVWKGEDAKAAIIGCEIVRPRPYGVWRRPRLRRVGWLVARARAAQRAWQWTR